MTMTNNTALYDVWDRLAEKVSKECVTPSERVYSGFSHCACGDVYVSSNIRGEEALLIELSEAAEKLFENPDIQGMTFSLKVVPPLDEKKTFLVIAMEEKHLLPEAFEAFSVTLMNELRTLQAPEDVVRVIAEVSESYSTFFSGSKSLRLDRKQEQGLFGELLILKEVIQHFGQASINTWTGPNRNKHDFIFSGNNAIEVKTTSGQLQHNISIASETQISFSPTSDLFLSVFTLEDNPSGKTIMDLAHEIHDVLLTEGIHQRTFERKLAENRVLYSSYTTKRTFVVVEAKNFLIDPSFPCITKANLNPKVFDVKYKINIDGIADFKGDIYGHLGI